MKWTVDVRQVRAHEPAGDLPTRFEAVIGMEKPTDADPVTLAEFRDLLVNAITNLNVPPTALILEDVRLHLRWP